MPKAAITEAELEVMTVLWKSDVPLSSHDLCAELKDKSWKYTTVSTLLSRLAEKGAVAYEKKGKSYFYTPLLDENDYKIKRTKNLIGKIYDGSVKNLVAALYESNEISERDIEELRKMFRLK
jgi:BlaI family penicillinase repressor